MSDPYRRVPSSVPSSSAEVGTRVKQIADDVGGVPRLAEVTRISESQLYRQIAGSNELKVSQLVLIAAAGGKSIAWLAVGAAEEDGQYSVQQPRAGYSYIPLYELAAKAGSQGTAVDHERVVDVLAFKEDWIRQELRARPDDLRLIYVEGDSMEPDLRAGDIILLDQTDVSARREGIYVLRMDGALLVKSLQRLPGGMVKVKSKNPTYEPFTLEMAELERGNGTAIIGRVVWACRRF